MADISADYAGIAETSSTLTAQCGIIIPEIYNLLGRVDTLLDNGLYLEQASPALKTAYQEFSRSLQMAASNIQGWANILTQISDSFRTNDAALFAASLSGIDGEGGYEVGYEEVTTATTAPPEWDDSRSLDGPSGTWNEDHSMFTPNT
ncbi:hypothetical protein RM780_17520 [Streptomyces sp. DSM 44917]|uniref:WXG100 family type VII secretion target n=1 Tax=Streptomyces boetiae TaxID=3075541 RepID=A0ABU2LAZ5_9ACTN|nr:hypothetical protein [Streptomyces sp. DSM 44917]MDT0308747.1 hypothetical protein [Streptomyces sp. DSM 44917]